MGVGNSALQQTVEVLLRTGGEGDAAALRDVLVEVNAKMTAIAAASRTNGDAIDVTIKKMGTLASSYVLIDRHLTGLEKAQKAVADAASASAERQLQAAAKLAAAQEKLQGKFLREHIENLAKVDRADEATAEKAVQTRDKMYASYRAFARADLAEQRETAAESLALQRKTALDATADQKRRYDSYREFARAELADQARTVQQYGSTDAKAAGDSVINARHAAAEKAAADNYQTAVRTGNIAKIVAAETRVQQVAANNLVQGGKAGQAFARGLLEASRGLEDLATGGFIGVLNNIPGTFQNMAKSAGMNMDKIGSAVAGVTVIATSAYLVWKNWDLIMSTFGHGNRIKEVADEMEELGKKTSISADEWERLNRAKNLKSDVEKQRAFQTDVDKEREKRVNEGVGKFGAGELENLIKKHAQDAVNTGFPGQQQLEKNLRLAKTGMVDSPFGEVPGMTFGAHAGGGKVGDLWMTKNIQEAEKAIQDAKSQHAANIAGSAGRDKTGKTIQTLIDVAKKTLDEEKTLGKDGAWSDKAYEAEKLIKALESAMPDTVKADVERKEEAKREKPIVKGTEKAFKDIETAFKHQVSTATAKKTAAEAAENKAREERQRRERQEADVATQAWRKTAEGSGFAASQMSVDEVENKVKLWSGTPEGIDAKREAEEELESQTKRGQQKAFDTDWTRGEKQAKEADKHQAAGNRMAHAEAMRRAEAFRKPLQLGEVQAGPMDPESFSKFQDMQANTVGNMLMGQGATLQQAQAIAPHIVQHAHDDLTKKQADVMSKQGGTMGTLADNQMMIASLLNSIMGISKGADAKADRANGTLRKMAASVAIGAGPSR